MFTQITSCSQISQGLTDVPKGIRNTQTQSFLSHYHEVPVPHILSLKLMKLLAQKCTLIIFPLLLKSLEEKVCGDLGIKSGPVCRQLPVADPICLGAEGPQVLYVFKGKFLFSIFPFLISHPLGLFPPPLGLDLKNDFSSLYQTQSLYVLLYSRFYPNYFL